MELRYTTVEEAFPKGMYRVTKGARSPYDRSFWKDEIFGYNQDVCITHLERIQFVRMMMEKEEEE